MTNLIFTGMHCRLARLFKTCIPLALTAAALLVSPAAMTEEAAGSSAVSDAKMDAILLELKGIRQVLEKIEKQGGRATAALQADHRQSLHQGQADHGCSGCTGHRGGIRRLPVPVLPALYQDHVSPPETKYIDTGKVRWVALNLPLPFHKDARKAAQAAHCAGEQDKFWEMRELLFRNPQKLNTENLPAHAEVLSLDMQAFNTCLQSDRHLAAIDQDAKDARAVHLTGTPSFIIGKTASDEISGQVVIGAQPMNKFDAAIGKALEEKPAVKKAPQ